MSQDRKAGLFSSWFGTKKKSEEQLEEEKASRQKLENRIREVLILEDPKPDHASDVSHLPGLLATSASPTFPNPA